MNTLQDFLPRFREIVSAREDWPNMIAALQKQVATEIDDLALAQNKVDIYGLVEAIPFIVQDTHSRFRRCVDLLPPPEHILCAPISVTDKVVSLNRSSEFFFWACWQAQETNAYKTFDEFHSALSIKNSTATQIYQQFMDEAIARSQKEPSVEQNVHNFVDMVAVLLLSFSETRKGLKPKMSRTLTTSLEEYIKRIQSQKSPQTMLFREVLGGASAVIADITAELHQQNVWVHTPYHSRQQSQLYERFVQWWDSDDEQTNAVAMHSGREDHPVRCSYVFEFDKGLSVAHMPGKPHQAQKKDRVIFRLPTYFGPQNLKGLPWSEAVLEDENADLLTDLPVRETKEWPSVPGFVRMFVDDQKKLHIRFWDQDRLQKVARQQHYIILGGIGLNTFQPTTPIQITQALIGQLKTLAADRARLHLELSGGAKKEDRLEPFAQSVRGIIHSIGLNDEELLALAQLSDFPLPPQSLPDWTGSLYLRYQQAKALAQMLCLDRLYVHGNDVDLILRKNASPGMLRKEIEATLFAKGLVVLAILKRSFKDDWMNKANELEETELTLSRSGFQVLLRFALDLYKMDDWATVDLEVFGRNGYVCDRTPDAYSFAVVPVMWPTFPANVISTGAGDICSGITVIYAGY